MEERAKSLLVVDDDPLVRETYSILLRQAGYTVELCGNGNAAMAYLRSHEVHAVLLDIFMPDREGLETLLDIKKQFPGTRVVVMSGGGASPRHDFLAIARKLGADEVLRKPVSIEAIVAAVDPKKHRFVAGRRA